MGSEAITITSNDLTVRYGHITALDNFSVNVPNGIVGLLVLSPSMFKEKEFP